MPDTTRKYDRIADALRQDILTGRFRQRLPGIHVLAEVYGANFKTVNRAVARLEELGLLRTLKGEGRVIVATAQTEAPKTVITLTRTEGHVSSDMTMALVRGLHAAGYSALPVDASHFSGGEAETARLLAHAPVGLVFDSSVSAARDFYERHGAVFARKVAWVATPANSYPDAVAVASDGCRGVYLATRHLVAQGRRRVLFVLHPWKWGPEAHVGSAHALMMQGYELALAEAGLAAHQRYLLTSATDDDGETLARLAAIFRESPGQRPDAVVSYADYLAAHTIREVRSRGLRVPQDIAVVGYYNTPWTELCEVPLSSVSVREPEIARATVAAFAQDYAPGTVITIEPELVVRDSSCPAGA